MRVYVAFTYNDDACGKSKLLRLSHRDSGEILSLSPAIPPPRLLLDVSWYRSRFLGCFDAGRSIGEKIDGDIAELMLSVC